MSVTCAEVERLLHESGKDALAANAEVQDHIGGCEACADLLIALEERQSEQAPPPAAAAATTTTYAFGVDTTTPLPTFVQPGALPADLVAASPEPAPPAAIFQASEPVAPTPPRSDPPPPLPAPLPPLAAVPSFQGPAPAAAPPLPGAPPPVAGPPPRDWIPAAGPQGLPPSDPWHNLARRASMRIKPVHFWMGSVGSALIGAAVVLIAVLIASRQLGPQAGAPAPAAVAAPTAPALVPPTHDDVDTPEKANATKGPTRPHNKARLAAPERAPEPTPTAKTAKALSTADVVAAMKDNIPKLAPCLESARKRNEITAGKHMLVLDFTITAAGVTKGAELKGPAEVLKTSLPACFAAKMRTWKFPPSQGGAPVKNFPLPINLK